MKVTNGLILFLALLASSQAVKIERRNVNKVERELRPKGKNGGAENGKGKGKSDGKGKGKGKSDVDKLIDCIPLDASAAPSEAGKGGKGKGKGKNGTSKSGKGKNGSKSGKGKGKNSSEAPSYFCSEAPSQSPSIPPSESPSNTPSIPPSDSPSSSPTVDLCPVSGLFTATSEVAPLSGSGGQIDLVLTGLLPAVGDVTLEFFARGDIDNLQSPSFENDEFYEAFDEAGNSLNLKVQGTGNRASEQCTLTYLSDTTTVLSTTFNTWNADDTVNFTLDASSDVSGTFCSTPSDGFVTVSYPC